MEAAWREGVQAWAEGARGSEAGPELGAGDVRLEPPAPVGALSLGGAWTGYAGSSVGARQSCPLCPHRAEHGQGPRGPGLRVSVPPPPLERTLAWAGRS